MIYFEFTISDCSYDLWINVNGPSSEDSWPTSSGKCQFLSPSENTEQQPTSNGVRTRPMEQFLQDHIYLLEDAQTGSAHVTRLQSEREANQGEPGSPTPPLPVVRLWKASQ
ncbi:hypothetical protein P7K49_014193 [Saguinus oedipus]|uniref:Uncharacterized protein n=1 Tax=Saguinus oedipus TaxID=9490 RepID=A0ABQ9VKC7_SAGOE|nr:hypothetical protein P7K49_014193 [Saguinus oedipus]